MAITTQTLKDVSTETTTTNKTNITIIPFIRESDIDFIGFNLRPNRESWVYFDGLGMNNFVSRPNIVKLDAKKNYGTLLLNTPREEVNIGGGRAQVLLSELDSDGKTILYLNQIKNPTMNVRPGNTVVGRTTSALANVVSYEHSSGHVRGDSKSKTTIPFSKDASWANNYYVGNVLSIVTGTCAGQSANITAYNGVTKVATVSPGYSAIVANNEIYSIGDRRKPYSSNTRQTVYTTPSGMITGTLHLPDPNANTMYSFKTGERLFRILDNPQNEIRTEDGEKAYTSRVDYLYKAEGIKQTDTTIRNITTTTTIANISTSVFDPIAQSFYVDGNIYPEGFFCPSIELYFKNRGSNLPVMLQIRPMDGGFPDSDKILEDGITVLYPQDIKTSDNPNTANSLTATKFVFPSPVYLAPDNEFAFVILTNDYGYDLYVSEIGQKQIGTNRIVSQQPYLGTMFKSQSGRTFTANQNEDVMFKINKCKFSTYGDVVWNEEKVANSRLPALANTTDFIANSAFDFFHLQSQYSALPGTTLNFYYRATSNGSGAMDASYIPFRTDRNVLVDQQKILYGDDYTTSFNVQMTLATTNRDVSPVVDLDKQNLVIIRDKINNMQLSNNIIAIVNPGNGYYNTNTALTFSLSSTGLRANGYVTSNATGGIQSVVLDNEASGYFEDATVTISSGTGSNGQIIINAETDTSGGPALARYISKTIPLRDGFDAGDLRCFITAVKPPSSNVQVYYKVRNKLDSDNISDKRWVKMVQSTSPWTYSLSYEPVELEFRPSLTSNNITYSTNTATYTTFNEFKIKVVLASSSTLLQEIPFIYDVSVSALPSDVY